MSSSTHRFHVALPDRQWQSLSAISVRTQITVSEIVRSMIERSLAQEQLNATYPTLSGQLREGR